MSVFMKRLEPFDPGRHGRAMAMTRPRLLRLRDFGNGEVEGRHAVVRPTAAPSAFRAGATITQLSCRQDMSC
jgi:hypothetical protein